MKLFGEEIHLREYHCSKNGQPPIKVDVPALNLYVRMNNICNAHCKFCEFTGKPQEQINFERLEYVLTTIAKNGIRINKLSFTGGEPTLDSDLLLKAASLVKHFNNDIAICVNTNGYNLKDIIHSPYFDSIALSRHHYDDELNNEILGFKAPGIEYIRQNNDDNIHLSCNLLKSYIGNSSDVVKYLDVAADNNIFDVGLVSLMQVNNYCKDQFVDFKSLDFSNYKRMYQNRNWCSGNCRCVNYLFAAPNGAVKMYARYYYKKDNLTQFVFNNNHLQLGFDGKIIY